MQSCFQMQGVVNFFGRISILIDQNTQAFHMFMTALLQVCFSCHTWLYLYSLSFGISFQSITLSVLAFWSVWIVIWRACKICVEDTGYPNEAQDTAAVGTRGAWRTHCPCWAALPGGPKRVMGWRLGRWCQRIFLIKYCMREVSK